MRIGRKKVKVSIIATLVLLLGLAGFMTYSVFATEKSVEKLSDELVAEVSVKEPEEEKEKRRSVGWLGSFDNYVPSKENTKLNFLLLGVDAREDDLTGRSDAMVVASFDKEESTVSLLSIPRDAYVPIIGKGIDDKITHAYAFGGAEMSKDTVENLLDIEIDYYMVFNFSSFTEIIDKLDGIEIDVPFSFSEQNAKGVKNALKFEEGTQTLNGEEALAYARMRKQDPRGDIGRGERQQQVIAATLDRLKETYSISTYISIFNTVRKSIDTDMGIMDITKLAPYVTSLQTINSHTMEGRSMTLDGIYYYSLDEDSLENSKQILQNN